MDWDVTMRKDTSVALLPLTGRQINSLWAARKHVLGDLSDAKQSELLALPGLSRMCLEAIDEKLKEAKMPLIDRTPLPGGGKIVKAWERRIVARERRKLVAMMHDSGMTFKDIAGILGISAGRAAQIHHSYEYHEGGGKEAEEARWDEQDAKRRAQAERRVQLEKEHQKTRGFFAPRTSTALNALQTTRRA